MICQSHVLTQGMFCNVNVNVTAREYKGIDYDEDR